MLRLANDQAKDDVFVFSGVEVAAEFVCRGPERRLEAKGGAVGGFFLSNFNFLHFADGMNCASDSNRKAAEPSASTQTRVS